MLIINAQVITWELPNRILKNSAIRIENSLITEIGPQNELIDKYRGEECLDAKGQFLMPGVICAHTHFYGTFSRGLNIPGSAPADFPEILKKLWWPLDQSLTHEDIKYSALVCLIDAIKHGTTTLFDHHASQNCISGSLDVIEEAFTLAGLRGEVCYEVTDRGGIEKADEGIAENIRMIRKLERNPKNHLVKAMFGMHAGLTLSEETLDKCRKQLPDNYGIHIHVAEHQVDEYDSLAKTNERVIDRLNRHDFLGENSIIVHGVHMDIKEIEQLAKTKTWLSHQPRSNMNNAVGMADIDSILGMRLKVCMGNDGFSNAMWDEWRTCYLVHKNWNHDPRRMNGNNVIQMAVYNNSDLVTHIFGGNRIGRIEKGAKADLILVDYEPITQVSVENLPWQILFGFRDSMVTTTMVDGKILMNDRILIGLNEKEISTKALELSKEVWNRYATQFN
jgi:putative selenium metabolism protein SsnA